MIKRITAVLIFVASFASVVGGNESKSFYDFQRSGKLIDKLQASLITEKASFIYGFQPYNQQNIVSTTCFYNQPSNMLHYVLTNSKKHTLHFQIPILDIDFFNVISADSKDKQFIELVYKDQTGMKVKEHNAKGGIIFSLRFTSYQIPVSNGMDMSQFTKTLSKVIKKADKFRS